MNRLVVFLVVTAIYFLLQFYLYQVFKWNFQPPRRWFSVAWIGLSLSVPAMILLSQRLPLPWQLYLYNMSMILIVTQLIVVVPLLFLDMIGGISGRISPAAEGFRFTPDRRKFLGQVGAVIALIPFSSLLYGLFRTGHDFKIHRVTLALRNTPAAFKGFRIVQISDIHCGSWLRHGEMTRAFELVMEQKPDLILFTGDLVNEQSKEALWFESDLKRLHAPHGVFAILGNHDYGDYRSWPGEEDRLADLQKLYDLYDRVGWTLLRNENTLVRKENDAFALIGVENWSHKKRFRTEGRLDLAIKGVEDVPLKILMSHDPSHWDAEVTQAYTDIQLTLSGHTHGFQFGIEIPGIKWSPSQWLYKQWAGLYQQGDQYVYVNRGLGCIGYSGRVGIRPEITVIELG